MLFRSVRPLTDGPLTSATAELETPYGRAASSWKKEDGKVILEVVVPPNTSATVIRPGDQPAVKVSAGTHTWSW